MELIREAAGRRLQIKDSRELQSARSASHVTIGRAIDEARAGLATDTGLPFGISRDACYQMSNRFAWSWKLAASGIPVVLVYLGFLGADDMMDKGLPLESHEQWSVLVTSHGGGIVPRECWEHAWHVNGQAIVPLIRTLDVPLAPVQPHS
ncbi:MAG: hypothetical protein IPP91_17340 [Betaproteobacteria bacterium]|nr:hypothetical protein [Betaproteobacteria bacterium]